MLSLLHLEPELELCGSFGYHELVLISKSFGGSELILKFFDLIFVFGRLFDGKFQLFDCAGIDLGLIGLDSVWGL
jgi:hypothetical protein